MFILVYEYLIKNKITIYNKLKNKINIKRKLFLQ